MWRRLIKNLNMEHYREQVWEDIKEERDGYKVIYYPANLKSENFATISVYANNSFEIAEVSEILKRELKYWTEKYPVSAMAFAFDKNGDLIDLTKTYSGECLTGFYDADDNSFKTQWGAINHNKMKDFSDSELAEIYKDLPHKTRLEKEFERDQKILKTRKQKKLLDFSFIVWLLVTIGIAYLGWQNFYVGGVAFFYAFIKFILELLSFFGISTSLSKKKREKERKMKHYYYHCERNPEGFRRLMAENIDEMRSKV